MDQSRHVLKRALAMLLVFALVFSYGFNANTITAEAASAKYVTKVTVAKKKLTVQAKKSATVKVTIKGSKGVSKAYTVKSNKPAIASVKKTSKGVKITGKKAGKATIVITTKAKTKKKKQLKAKIAVTVKAAAKKTTQATTQATTAAPTVAPTQAPTQAPTKAPEVLKKITVAADPTTITEKGGQTKVSVASDPAGIALASVTYESSNEQIATVKNGVVTGVNPGKVTIKVVAKDAQGNVAEGTVEVTVTEANAINAKISFNAGEEKGTVALGETKKISPTVTADKDDYEIVWTSSNEKVATVKADGKSGIITTVGAGSAVITATVKGTNASVTYTITVEGSAPSITSFKATHADVLTVKFSSAFKAADTEKVNVSLKYGQNDFAATPVWSEDGTSVDLKLKSEYKAGTYTVNVDSEEVALGATKTMTCDVEKRDINAVEIITKNIPCYKKSKIKYEAKDQYGDVMENIPATDFEWRISCSNYGVSTDDAILSRDIGSISVRADYDKLEAGKDFYEVKATYRTKGEVTDTEKVSVDYLKIKHVEIKGIKQTAVYQDNEYPQIVEMLYEAKDQFGNDVDMETYYEDLSNSNPQTRAYKAGINSWTENDQLVSAPTVLNYNGEKVFGVIVYPGQSGKAKVRVDGDDGIESVYTVEVFKEKLPKKVIFPEASSIHVAAGEVVDIPVTFEDQYGNKLDPGVVKSANFTKYFSVIATGFDEIKDSDVTLYNGTEEDFIRVDASNVPEAGTINIELTSRITGIENEKSTFKLQVTDVRNANKIEITKEPLATIMQGQSTKIEFKILDSEGNVWKNRDTYKLDVQSDGAGFIVVSDPEINDQGEGYVTVSGGFFDSQTAVSDKTVSLKLTDRSGKVVLSTTEKFKFAVEQNVDSFTAKTDDTSYKAGKPVKITLTAKDTKNNVLTTYDEKFDVKVKDDKTGKFTLVKNVQFTNGVATIEVIADKAYDDVTYSGTIVSPDNKSVSFKTNTVKIEASDATALAAQYDGSYLVVSFVDVQGNVVKTETANSLNVKVINKNGNDITKNVFKNSKLSVNNDYILENDEEFEDGESWIDVNNGSIPSDAVVTITTGDLTFTGSLEISSVN